MKLSIIIPVYNEANHVEALLRNVLQVALNGLDREIIVVDDGSTDGTYEQLAKIGASITLIRHARNLGKGAAIQTGARAMTGDVLLIQDADLEYDPNDYLRVVDPIVRGDADAVMGSRFLLKKPTFFTKPGEPFFLHYIGNQLIIWLTNVLYQFQATDYEGCYKAFTARVIRDTPIRATGFEFDNELMCKLLRQHKRIVEVPIRYTPRAYREGKKIRWQHGVRMLWTVIKWRILPLPHPSRRQG